MTKSEELAAFCLDTKWSDVPARSKERLKVLLLDALGCALGAVGQGPMPRIRAVEGAFGGAPRCTLVGGGASSPDRAASYNTMLERYLDFMDGFATKDEACHPADNAMSVLAVAEDQQRSGRELLAALAVAYEVQTRLIEEAPITTEGFDHTTQLAMSIACGASKLMGLSVEQAASAIGIAGDAHNSLRVLRTGHLSHWKGLASGDVATGAVYNTYLAQHDITGPSEFFEGKYGYEEALADKALNVDWSWGKDDRIPRIFTKEYNAEIHAQSAIEGLLELRARERIDPEKVKRIDVETFKQGWSVIGGGHGDAYHVDSKEQADHSYPYVLAVALLDGDVWPEQYAPERIRERDVQQLLKRVGVEKSWTMTLRYPQQWPVKLTLRMMDGAEHVVEKEDWDGFTTRPWDFPRAREKFDRLAAASAPQELRDEIARVVERLEDHTASELAELLGDARAAASPRPASALTG
jgi:2-methylcitrate dehydratase